MDCHPVQCASHAPSCPALSLRPQAKGDASALHIIIFDEIDAICKSRGSVRDGSGVHDTVVNQLLTKVGVDGRRAQRGVGRWLGPCARGRPEGRLLAPCKPAATAAGRMRSWPLTSPAPPRPPVPPGAG